MMGVRFQRRKYHDNKLFPGAFSTLVGVLFSNGVGSKANHSKFTTVGSWAGTICFFLTQRQQAEKCGPTVVYCQACNRIKQILVLSGWIKIFSSLKTWDGKTAAPLAVLIMPPHWFPFDHSRTIKTKAELINTKQGNWLQLPLMCVMTAQFFLFSFYSFCLINCSFSLQIWHAVELSVKNKAWNFFYVKLIFLCVRWCCLSSLFFWNWNRLCSDL